MPLQQMLYVENNVGRNFCTAFNAFSKNHAWGAVFQNDVHRDMQRKQHGDEWWLAAVAKLGYALLTCDMAITSVESERSIVVENGLRYIGFANADYDGWAQLGAVIRHWDRLSEALSEPGPTIIKLYVGSKTPEVVTSV